MPINQHELFQVKHCNRLLPLPPWFLPFLWHSLWLLHSLRRCCLNQPITLHESGLTRWLSAADSTSGSVQYMPTIKLIMHRDEDCISTRKGCMLKLNLTSKERAEGVSETWRSVGSREEARKHTMNRLPQQLQLSFEIPHHLVTSFLCCTALQIPCTRVHTCKCTHPTHCVRTLAAYARVFVYPKRSLWRLVGAGIVRRREGWPSFPPCAICCWRSVKVKRIHGKQSPALCLCVLKFQFFSSETAQGQSFSCFFPPLWGGWGQCFSGPLAHISWPGCEHER